MGTAVLVLVVAACGVASRAEPGQENAESVRGLIRDVQSSSFSGIGSLTIEDDKGATWVFEGRDVAIPGVTPSHLRDHMLLGLPVVVRFRRENGALVLSDVEDAPSGAP